MPAVAGAFDKPAQARAFFRQLLFQLERVNAAVGQQAQPFAHQRGTPFWGVDAVAGDFHRRTHRAFHIEVKAQPVAVTLHRAAPGSAYRNRNLAVIGAALNGIHLQHRRINALRRADFSRIEAVIRIERGLHLTQLGVELFAKKGRAVLGAEPLAVLAPQQTAVFGREGHDLVGDRLHQDLLLRIAHVQRRAHVQHARVNVPEHAIAQTMAVEQRAKLHDIIRQMFRRHAGIFRKRNRLRRPFRVAEQPHRLFTHRVDSLDAGEIVTQLPANDAAFPLRNQLVQTLAERAYLALNQLCVIPGELDDVQAEHLFIRHVGNQFAHRMPDNILPGQVQDF